MTSPAACFCLPLTDPELCALRRVRPALWDSWVRGLFRRAGKTLPAAYEADLVGNELLVRATAPLPAYSE